ncbi:MAG: hypothetical protein LBQ52_04705 [Helicobacteraceae bacterium]|jgi:hypothetical protein|nr:hypothetical protein [Helicobacteraceae bacterium]
MPKVKIVRSVIWSGKVLEVGKIYDVDDRAANAIIKSKHGEITLNDDLPSQNDANAAKTDASKSVGEIVGGIVAASAEAYKEDVSDADENDGDETAEPAPAPLKKSKK